MEEMNNLLRVKLENAQNVYNECKNWKYSEYRDTMRDFGGFSMWEIRELRK